MQAYMRKVFGTKTLSVQGAAEDQGSRPRSTSATISLAR